MRVKISTLIVRFILVYFRKNLNWQRQGQIFSDPLVSREIKGRAEKRVSIECNSENLQVEDVLPDLFTFIQASFEAATS
jgi:hypothetical protein